MSRFLDAMRDKGKSADADDAARSYKGKIVDAGDVLGPRFNDDSPLEEPEELSIHPLIADGEDKEPPLSVEAVSDNTIASGSPTGQQESVTRRDQVQPVVSNNTYTAADKGGGSAAPVEMPITAAQQPVVNKSTFSVRSLDPLFYLVVGIAAVGLFASLYALITQNDAYFEREYQQLQKESAALQARLAASSRLEAALSAAASAQRTAPAVSSMVPNTEFSDSSASTAEVPVIPIAERQAEASLLPVVDAQELGEESSALEVVAEPVVVAAPEPEPVVVEKSINESDLDMLRQEMESLRLAMSNQQDKINRLEQDNLELTSIVGQAKTEIRAVTRSTNPPTVQVAAQPSPRSDDVQADLADTGGDAPVIKPQSSMTVAVIGSPVLETPVAESETEITGLVQQGYLAYQAHDFIAASNLYGKALEFDPYDRDANLGVAAAAQASGDLKLAEDRYRHLLTLDPADEVAFSALLNLSVPSGQGSAIEFELTQHAEYVGSPRKLYAILGNYYSQQKRWSSAESAYVVAMNDGISSPDYLFNYAVVLDNMGRTTRAAEYYSQALSEMDSATHSFDAQAARQRLDSLLANSESE